MYSLGIIFSVLAMFGWGLGDFYIQKSTRKVGSTESLFFICLFAALVLMPFSYQGIGRLNSHTIWPMLIITIATLAAVSCNFQAFKIGKISVIETVLGIELPLTLVFSVIFKGEIVNVWQVLLILLVFCGILFATSEDLKLHLHIKEKGVWLAVLGAVVLAVINVFMGIASIETSPLFANWFTSVLVALILFAYLYQIHRVSGIAKHLEKNIGLLIKLGIIDNGAWIAYSYAVTFIPVAIAATVSEGYIALAAGLGIWVNHEKLKRHQMIGVFVAIGAIIVLSAISKY